MKILFIFLFSPMTCLIAAAPDAHEFLHTVQTLHVLNESSLQKLGFGNATVDDVLKFLHDLQNDVLNEYGCRLNLLGAIKESKETMLNQPDFSPDDRFQLSLFYDALFEKLTHKELGLWNFGSSKNKQEKPQLELPAKIAAGFMCSLGGALLCIVPIPVIQGIGVGLVTTGIGLAMDGMSSGERPYYVDPRTGQRIP